MEEPGPLEQEIIELLQGAAQGMGSLWYAAGDPEWWKALDTDRRFELFFSSFAGLADALRRLAREIDEARGSIIDDRDD